MKAPQLETINSQMQPIEPNVERDSALSFTWLEGEIGKRTLSLMGVPDKENQGSSLEAERARVQGFIEGQDQLNWTIKCEEKIVGSIWVDLKKSDHVPAPSIHIMIGDVSARGKGVGDASARAVLGYMIQKGEHTIYSRRLVKNQDVAKLFDRNGFEKLGESYRDGDGLEWQNVIFVNHSKGPSD